MKRSVHRLSQQGHKLCEEERNTFKYPFTAASPLLKVVDTQQTSVGPPDGSVVKNAPANARGMSSIPGPGRPHVGQNRQARAPQPRSLSPRAAATAARERGSRVSREAAAAGSAHTASGGGPVLCDQRSAHSNQGPHGHKKTEKRKRKRVCNEQMSYK